MALQITFKTGERQALSAGQYFQEEANAMVNNVLDACTPRNYFIHPSEGPAVPIRFWAPVVLADNDLTALALFVDRMEDQVEDIVRTADTVAKLGQAHRQWSGVPWPTATFFLERMGPKGAFGPNEEVRTSMAVIDRHLVLISAPRLIHCALASGLYGTAIAGKGSYLIEQVDASHDAVQLPSAHHT